MKVFKDRPSRTEADFNKELQILDELRKSANDHIVTHLTTWTQDERYYMLFPYAQCNLRQYMRRAKFGKPTKRNTLWLLNQFLGLGNALREIHNLPDADSTTTDSSTNLLAPATQLRKSGWHHDLKPENILYFRKLSSSGGEFQIADFGTGKVHTYRSGSVNTKSPNGTPTYEPPEYAKEGVTSRPYDVWSMGCVFLELLVWAIFDWSSVKAFESDRDQRRFPGTHIEPHRTDDAFWQMTEDGTVSLRQSVKDWITKLQDELRRQKLEPFEKALKLVAGMLETDRQTRISALDLWNKLDSINKKATEDMKTLKSDSLVAAIDKESSRSPLPLPQLSTKTRVRRTPEPISPAFTDKSDAHPPRAALYTGEGLLTASPQATSSTRDRRRNSSISNYTLSSRPRGLSDSSMRVQDGSSPGRTPESFNEGG